MYDNPIIAASCQVSGLDWVDGPMDIDDLAFIQLILSMEQSDQALMDKMNAIRELHAQKKAISEEITNITRAMEEAEADSDSDWVYVEGGVEGDIDISTEGSSTLERMFLDSPIGQILVLDNLDDLKLRAACGNQQAAETLAEYGHYQKKDLDAYVEKLQQELVSLNDSSELMMIDLSRLMNKRNQAVQLTTNIMQSSHQSAMGIIANFK